MKKLLLIMISTWFFSCNSNSKGEDFGDTTGANIPAIENVNGNIPDTTNSIMIDDTSGRSPIDTVDSN
jgi:hypothetical protein